MTEKYAISLDVSIPQGTIKRPPPAIGLSSELQFQFHKVRLKDVLIRENFACAILFQFHKVRLKEKDNSACYNCAMFQFHKVRLKDLAIVRVVADGNAFQFHKVRLKEK